MTDPLAPLVVLVLADDDTVASALRERLPGHALRVEQGRLAEVADRCDRERYAAIVVDARPAMASAVRIAEALRASPGCRMTPIVLLTIADPPPATVDAAAELGAVDVVPAPPDVDRLAAKVRGHAALHRAAEPAAREAEQLRLIVEGTKDYAIFMLDPDGHIATWNAGARVLKGYEASEVLGRHLSLFYPPDVVASGWVEHELRVARDAGRFEDEGWRVRKDGTRFWANVVITALRAPDGTLRGFAKVTRDLTSRRLAEESARQLAEEAASRRTAEGHAAQLAADKERLRVTLSSIGDAVISTDREARVDFMNPVAEALTGWTTADAAGTPLVDIFRIINETSRAPVDNPALRALAEGAVVGLANHTLLVARDGTEHPIDDSAAPIRDADGQVIGSVLVFREIGHRRKAEAELREQKAVAETLLRVGRLLGEESDLHRMVQVVTDETTRLCGAKFGAFFYNVDDDAGESYMLYTLSGIPRAAFEKYPMPRNTAVFGPTFRGEDIVRLDDVTADPRYGHNAPYQGMPPGHPPVRSYLAASVVSRSGEVLGGLFFGHDQPGVFTAHHEQLLRGIAAQAAVAIDNARLFHSAQSAAERLHLALDAADLGDWRWDVATDEVTLSERAAEIFGVAPRQRITWTALQERLHPVDRDRARAEVERVIAERLSYAIEYRVERDGGDVIWVGALGRGVYDDAGQVTGMYGVVQDVSERKRLEQSLRDSEARFRSLMEQAPFSIQVFDADGRTLRVNRAWEDLWGATLEELAQYNILHDAQLERMGVMPQIRAAFAGVPSTVPAIRYDPNETLPDITRHDDPVRWVAAVAYPIRDDAGVVRQVVLVHDDVTARHRAEDALRRSEERLRLALDAGRMGVWDWNVRTGGLEWSDSLEPLHGLAPGTFEGTFEHFVGLVHPDDRDGVAAAIQSALERRGSFQTEFRNRRGDGSVHWIAGSGQVLTDEAGEPVRMIGIGMDVTARRRREQTARFLSAASAALAEIVDFESTLQKVAALAVPAFADWAAVDVLEPDGSLRRVAMAHHDPQRVADARALHRRWPGRPDAPLGPAHIVRTGRPQLVQLDARMLEDAVGDPEAREAIAALGLRSFIGVPLTLRGKVRGAITFVTAESGRTSDEADLEVARELAHRTAVAIENAELYEEMREADRRKDEFLATLAHELRNPLAPLRSGLDVLDVSGSMTPGSTQVRAMMGRQVEHLVRLVDDLLDVSRITRNRLELRREPLALADVIQSAVETSSPLIGRAGNPLTVDVPAAPIHVLGVRVRLAQVFSNLLNNAAKYTPAGGAITLRVAREGDRAVVRVRDRGLGIPADALDTVFDMFTQVHRATVQAQGGLGIGLTLVRRLVELHGGTVEAHSDGPGTGSEFVVRLPVLATGAEPAAPPARAAALPAAPRRVLVVDDNVDAARSLEMMLGLMGHDVRTSHDGPEALAQARAFRPELVLLDIGLPSMSGYDVCRALRAEPWGDEAVLVALTGWGQEEDRRRSDEAGFDDHVVKPVSAERLADLLQRVRPGLSSGKSPPGSR